MIFWGQDDKFQSFYSVTKFYLGHLGSDCPVPDIVSKKEDCKYAGNNWDTVFRTTSTDFDRPAGCYFFSNTSDCVFFNLANPSDTQDICSTTKGKRGKYAKEVFPMFSCMYCH